MQTRNAHSVRDHTHIWPVGGNKVQIINFFPPHSSQGTFVHVGGFLV